LSSERKERIIWPEYIDIRLSRRLGRKVPKEIALDRIKKEEVILACKEMNLDCEIIEGKKYPRTWFSSYGWYLVVRTNESKLSLMKKLAKVLKDLRSK